MTGKEAKDLDRFAIPSLKRARMSFSGHERNHLFMNRSGDSFDDVSGISGLNTDADSRSIAIVDFDQDGWQDIVLANISAPVISFYRNQMGSQASSAKNNSLKVDCIGGNTTDKPSTQFGARDGYGAKVKVIVDSEVLLREKRCGEGLAAQNSQRLHFGLGKNRIAQTVEVTWPSGTKQTLDNVEANKLVRVFEDPEQSPDGSGFELLDAPHGKNANRTTPVSKSLVFQPNGTSDRKYNMYVSMATWCENCKKHLPDLQFLRENYALEELAMVAVAIDETDTIKKLSQYMVENSPAYEMPVLSMAKRRSFSRLIKQKLGSSVLPSTVVTDADGNVVEVFTGIATISQLSKIGVEIKSQGE